MASRNERGRDAGLRERLVGGVSRYVERPAALPGAGGLGGDEEHAQDPIAPCERIRGRVRDDDDVTLGRRLLDRGSDQVAVVLAVGEVVGYRGDVGVGPSRRERVEQPLDERLSPLGVGDEAGIDVLARSRPGDDLLVEVAEPEPLGDVVTDLLAEGADRPGDADHAGGHQAQTTLSRWATTPSSSAGLSRSST